MEHGIFIVVIALVWPGMRLIQLHNLAKPVQLEGSNMPPGTVLVLFVHHIVKLFTLVVWSALALMGTIGHPEMPEQQLAQGRQVHLEI